jgi:hypothetical protein
MSAPPHLDINEIIGFQISSTAEWRRLKAQEFPDDLRNLSAAEELDRLASEVAQLDGSDTHEQISKLMENYADLGIWNDLHEEVSVALRGVGFHHDFKTGDDLLKWYRDKIEQAVRDAINSDSGGVASPVLAEQAASEPKVKAAKKVYLEVYAEALAEARKRL